MRRIHCPIRKVRRPKIYTAVVCCQLFVVRCSLAKTSYCHLWQLQHFLQMYVNYLNNNLSPPPLLCMCSNWTGEGEESIYSRHWEFWCEKIEAHWNQWEERAANQGGHWGREEGLNAQKSKIIIYLLTTTTCRNSLSHSLTHSFSFQLSHSISLTIHVVILFFFYFVSIIFLFTFKQQQQQTQYEIGEAASN